ncbi:MAG TPA: FHA domain-containing protein [Acidobacteriaceae bacterium]|nr:FHA domain-containing protein [Acidobacteriaceae bacterium]
MAERTSEAASPAVTVCLPGGDKRLFHRAFRIGRSNECEICIGDHHVSRVHAEVKQNGGGWQIEDRNSSNGLFHQGRRETLVRLTGTTAVRLGADGPELIFAVGAEPARDLRRAAGEDTLIAHYAQRYFGGEQHDQPAGEHTIYVRRAFARVQRRQHRRYAGVIVVLVAVAACMATYALHLHREVLRQRELARDIFYGMKSLDVEIASLRATVDESHNDRGAEVLTSYQARRQQMERSYENFLANPHVYKAGLTQQQRIILYIARTFGECDLDMPADFQGEVERYIRYWQASGRYDRDIRLAKEKGYTESIPKELEAHGLPRQFFYLAMQESDFNPYSSGPMTRMGIAKGMWQFIPGTAVRYGLHLGPLTDVPQPDPSDEREQFPKATRAAAEYLQTLYSTDAQASALLVMACYNWGEFQVLPLVRSMPADPRERNFWKLLAEHRDRIPQQTYDYVFYIVSAAVIGENPRLFGFDFDNPLQDTAVAAVRAGSAPQRRGATLSVSRRRTALPV